MGSNRRYADSIDKRMDARILQSLAQQATPDSLKRVETDLDHEPVTIPPQPIPVRAWVRYRDTPVLVEAELFKWTDRACAIRWQVLHVGEHRARV